MKLKFFKKIWDRNQIKLTNMKTKLRFIQ